MIKPITELTEKHQQMYALLLAKDNPDEFEVVLTATTNQAASVLSDLTGREANTIYSFLGLKVFDNISKGTTNVTLSKNAEIIYNKVIIIDESSMLNGILFHYIETRTKNCKVVLVGDWFQLISVGQKIVTMKQVSDELSCPTVVMNEIMRNSGIIMETGQQFRKTVETGIFEPIPMGHKELYHATGDEFQALIDAEYLSSDYTPKTARIMAYTNQRVLQYSSYVRGVTGSPEELQVGETVITNKPIIYAGARYSTDSEVEITGVGERYEYEDSGIWGRDTQINERYTSFMPLDNVKARAYIKYLGVEGRKNRNFAEYFDAKNTWLDLRTAYASTIHKAQGATCDTVFIDLPDIGSCYNANDVARLLYVGITRAKHRVVLYGKLPDKYGG